MADFRKSINVFAVLALLAGFTVSASAQALMVCNGTGNNPLIRAEEYTAETGDIFITCTGGIPTAAGQLVPKVDITVFMNAPITSKITDNNVTPNFNEALLIIDEGGSVGSTAGLLNCGNAAAPYGNTPQTCDVFGNGTGIGIYDGTAGRPNVYQGRQVSNSNGTAIQFIGVPLDPPDPGNGFTPGRRTLRITNVRVNAVAFGITGGFNLAATTQANVVLNGTNFSGPQIISLVNGTVRSGLVVSTTTNANPAGFFQCSSTPGNATNTINLAEAFPAAFKVRNWRQIQDNGTPPPVLGGDWIYAGTVNWSASDLNQNVPNALYSTETGLMFPPVGNNPSPDNPPPGTAPSGTAPGGTAFSDAGAGGIDQSGTVTQGTRFAIRFSTVPAGSNPSIPNTVNLMANATVSGVMVLVAGTDAAGAGGTPITSGGTTKISALTNGLAVYEVLFSNPSALETATVVVTVAPVVNLSGVPPTPEVSPAALTALVGFAPAYGGGAGADVAQLMSSQMIAASPDSLPPVPASAPAPRFADVVSSSIEVFSYAPCAGLTGLITGKSGPANARDWVVSLTVTNQATAVAARVTGLTLTQTSGPACTPVIATPFPINFGDLTTSGTGDVTIDFRGCSAIARFTAVLSFSADNAPTGSKTLFNQFR